MQGPAPHATTELDKDLSPEWLQLSRKIRALAEDVRRRGGDDVALALAHEAQRLCGHVERLHADVQACLLERGVPPHPAGSTEAEQDFTEPDEEAVQREAMRIQREIHEPSRDIRQVIKALFLWRDDPVDRVAGRDDGSGTGD